MPEGHVLDFSGVTKRFGAVTAVDGLSARVEPGVVTGFLGPNGAGKTTSLRILLGLVGATSGSATIGGKRYRELRHPLQTVGAALEASSFHPGRTAAAHLTVYARAAGIPRVRVDEALGLVGLADVAGRKVGGFSLGMRQRLGLAYTLLGDPGVLVLDEPANGLDPEGIKWMRGFLRELARQGRTVLVSSHLLSEVQQSVDALLIIAQGRLVFQGPLDALTSPDEYATVVDSPDRGALSTALRAAGLDIEVLRTGLVVRGTDAAEVGAIAAGAGVALSALQKRGPALEEVFLDLVNGIRVHESATGLATAPAPDEVEAEAPAPAVEPEIVAEPEAAESADSVDTSEPAEEPGPVEADEAPADGAPADEAPADEAPADDTNLTEVTSDADDAPEAEDAEPSEDEAAVDVHWDADQEPTEADAEADAFFSRYDHAADTAPDADAQPAPEAEPDTDGDGDGDGDGDDTDDETEGGAQR